MPSKRRSAATIDIELKCRRVRVVSTDFALARTVGAILHAASADTRDLVDAHWVALCAAHGGGVVVTEDPDDIIRLASTVPAVRVTVRRPR